MTDLEEIFEELYIQKYRKMVLFLCSISAKRPLAEDIAQDAFIKAYLGIGSLRDQSKVSAWLYKIAYNLYQDYKRKQKPSLLPVDEANPAAEAAGLGKSTTTQAERNIMSECVQSKLKLLPENYRLALMLDMQGYSNREKARIMGCSLNSAKIRLHRARNRMKDILGRDCTFYHDNRNVLC